MKNNLRTSDMKKIQVGRMSHFLYFKTLEPIPRLALLSASILAMTPNSYKISTDKLFHQ